jgi:peptidoglycan/LPS O-acetylase OafA/YrhL
VNYNGKSLLLPLIGNAWIMDLLAIAYLAAVVALGALAYRYVEVPGQALILRLGSRRPAATVGAPAR